MYYSHWRSEYARHVRVRDRGGKRPQKREVWGETTDKPDRKDVDLGTPGSSGNNEGAVKRELKTVTGFSDPNRSAMGTRASGAPPNQTAVLWPIAKT